MWWSCFDGGEADDAAAADGGRPEMAGAGGGHDGETHTQTHRHAHMHRHKDTRMHRNTHTHTHTHNHFERMHWPTHICQSLGLTL